MKVILVIMMILLCFVSSYSDISNKPTANKSLLESIPLIFIENKGQVEKSVSFYVKGRDKILYFLADGITYSLCGNNANSDYDRWNVKLHFVGSNSDIEPIGLNRQKTIVSYFHGNPGEWNTGLPTYDEIIYYDIWPGIDLVFSGTVDRLKYELMVQPGADPDQIRFAYEGAAEVYVNPSGELVVETPVGGFTDGLPFAYQEINGHRVEISMDYRLSSQDGNSMYEYGFAVGDYDRTRTLILDPAVIVYSGFIGGTAEERGEGIAVDDSGNVYITGRVYSSEASFPVTAGPDMTYNSGVRDAFVARVNAAGTSLDYCGYIGGDGDEIGMDIAVDASGCAYVCGFTSSGEATFPVVVGPDLTFNGGQNAFVAKLNSSGTALEYCGYIGGNGGTSADALTVDLAGNAYVGGHTNNATGFPVVTGPDLTFNGGTHDAFIAKVTADGTSLDYCGFIGGDGYEEVNGVAVDGSGNAYIVGPTGSSETFFPVAVGPDLSYNGGIYDAYVARVNADGTGLDFCGYIGGEAADQGRSIKIDQSGNIYIAGQTVSSESTFPVTVGPDLTFNGGDYDAFAAKLNSSATVLEYCGYIGGDLSDIGIALDIDLDGNAYISGYTASSEATFPVISGPDLTYGGGSNDAFVARINSSGSNLDYCGYIGGDSNEYSYGIAVDMAGNAYVAGLTTSKETTFPVAGGPDLTQNGDWDAFVTKIAVSPEIVDISPAQNALNVAANSDITVTFNTVMDEASINSSSFVVHAYSSGLHTGTYSYDAPSRTATFNPDNDFLVGEIVTVTLTVDITASSIPLSHSFVWTFTTGVGSHNQGGFVLDSVYTTGDSCYHLTVADYNNDGYPDLSTANQGDRNISVYLNNGDGTLGSYATYSTSGDPRTTYAGDVNGDGYMDIVTANAFSDTISVYINDGDGTFAPEVLYISHGTPINALLADLDGDGDLDMFATNNEFQDVSVFTNDGSGNFINRQDYPIPSVNRIIATDIDNDGDLDLVSANTGAHNVAILPNDGDATFGAYTTEPTANDPWGICAADFDGDGFVDIATANGWQNVVCVLTNNQAGGLNGYVSYPINGTASAWLYPGDVNGDGIVDLVTANGGTSNVSALLNNGSAQFPSAKTHYIGGLKPYTIFLADMDLDNDLDIVTVNYDSDNISVLLNEPLASVSSVLPAENEIGVPVSTDITVTFDSDMDASTFTASSIIVIGSVSGGHSGSIDYDGPSRTATFNPSNNFAAGEQVTVTVTSSVKSTAGTPVENNYYSWSFYTDVSDLSGSGIFVLDSNYAAGDSCHGIFAADFNNDGYVDIAAGNRGDFNISVYLNDGAGTFGSYATYPASGDPRFIWAGDVDNDGYLDIVSADAWSDSVSVFLNDGGGGFGTYTPYKTNSVPIFVSLADINGDGNLDMISCNWSTDDISVFTGYGNGSFGNRKDYPAGTGVNQIYAVDLDNDGDLDLAGPCTASHEVAVFLNPGDNSFHTYALYPTANDPWGMAVSDIDDDGYLDLITANGFQNVISLLLNDGDGTFGTYSAYAVGGTSTAFLATGDFNGDVHMDIVAIDGGSAELSVFLNDAMGGFLPAVEYPSGEGPRSVCAADIDNDGDLDVISANRDSDDISVLINIPDADGDGIADIFDNCPEAANAGQEDGDGDGTGDACDGCPDQPGDWCGNSYWAATSGNFPNEICPEYELVDSGVEDPNFLGDTLVLSTGDKIELMYYKMIEPLISSPDTLLIKFKMRYISGTSDFTNQTGCQLSFVLGERRANILYIGADEIFVWTAIFTPGVKSILDTDDEYHDYFIEIETSSGDFNIYYDDSLIITGAAFTDINFGNLALIAFGDGTATESAETRWLYFKHNAYTWDQDYDLDGVTDSCDNCPEVANADQEDGDGDGIGDACDFEGVTVSNLDDSGVGSLRWAIDSANDSPGSDSIFFGISGTINLITALPAITDNWTKITGNSAPGGAHSIILDGTSVVSATGLTVDSDNNTISGLTIINWDVACITLSGNDNRIENCHINVNQAGNTRLASGGDGIYISGSYNIIGGCSAEERNIIACSDGMTGIYISAGSFNEVKDNYINLSSSGTELIDPPIPGTAYGVRIVNGQNNYIGDSTCSATFIAGNLIGVNIANGLDNQVYNCVLGSDVTLVEDIPNSEGIALSGTSKNNIIGPGNSIVNAGGAGNGISLNGVGVDSNTVIGNNINLGNFGIYLTGAKYNRIGGYEAIEKNVVTSTTAAGIYIYANADSNCVIGNRIGGDLAHPSDMNLFDGVVIDFNSDDNLVDSNTIAYNGGDGIKVIINSTRNTITRNLIYNNDFGIDLNNDGVTLNDPGDADTGPNGLLNYPEIDSVTMNPDSSFTVWGNVPNDTRVEFFIAHPAGAADQPEDISGHGQAYSYIGFADVTGVKGDFSYIIPNTVEQFSIITATATDAQENTSEFCQNFVLMPGPLIFVAYGFLPGKDTGDPSSSIINIWVTDPNGDYIGKDASGTLFQTIPEATYDENGIDSVTVEDPLTGEYTIEIIGQEGAPEGGTYAIGIQIDGSNMCISGENLDAPASGVVDTFYYQVEEDYHYINGDANRDETLNILDITFLISFLYKGGLSPDPYASGDADCNQTVNILDITYLISYLYKGGPEPCEVF